MNWKGYVPFFKLMIPNQSWYTFGFAAELMSSLELVGGFSHVSDVPKACCILLPCEGSITTRKLFFALDGLVAHKDSKKQAERERDASTLGQCRII